MSAASVPEIEQEMAQFAVDIGQNLTNTYVNSECAGAVDLFDLIVVLQCRRFASYFTMS